MPLLSAINLQLYRSSLHTHRFWLEAKIAKQCNVSGIWFLDHTEAEMEWQTASVWGQAAVGDERWGYGMMECQARIAAGDLNGFWLINYSFGRKQRERIFIKIRWAVRCCSCSHIIGRWDNCRYRVTSPRESVTMTDNMSHYAYFKFTIYKRLP